MAQSIFGSNNNNNPGNKVIGGSSMQREKAARDLKLKARKPRSDVKSASARSGVVGIIGGRVAE
jgi:hypothetical protein